MKHTPYFIMTVLAIFIIACGKEQSSSPSNPFDSGETLALVTWVVDGDTFYCRSGDEEGKIRVLGIDTFETSPGDRLDTQADKAGISADSALALGLLAKSMAIELLYDKEVVLIRDPNEYDKDVYDRYLRYVLVDGMRYDSIITARGFSVP